MGSPPPPFAPQQAIVIPEGPEIPEARAKRVTQDLLVQQAKKKPGKEGLEKWCLAQSHLHLSGTRLTHLNLDSIPVRGVRTIYAYDNKIAYVSGLNKLFHLENLYLQDNKVYTLAGWSEELPDLKQLHIQSNAVPALTGLTASNHLEELLINDQCINAPLTLHAPTLKAMAHSLRTLDVSRNGITDLSPLAVLLRLQSLTASGNKVEAAGLFPVLDGCQFLLTLWVEGNPLTKKRKWQDDVILRSNSVQEIDGKEVGKTRTYLQNLQARKARA